MPKKAQLTQAEFSALVPDLKSQLSAALEKERTDCALPDTFDSEGSDLWELPAVDSKSVAKLSPLVREAVGHRLDPRWIRKGGYESVDAAVDHLIDQLTKHVFTQASADDISYQTASVTPTTGRLQ